MQVQLRAAAHKSVQRRRRQATKAIIHFAAQQVRQAATHAGAPLESY